MYWTPIWRGGRPSGMTLDLSFDPLPASPFQGEEGDSRAYSLPLQGGGLGWGSTFIEGWMAYGPIQPDVMLL